MLRAITSLALVVALSLSLTAHFASASESTQSQITGILRSLGYDDVFRSFGPAIALGVTATEERPEVARQLEEAVELSFEPESIVDRIVERTDAALTPEITEAVANFYNTPFGREVAALERSVVQDGVSAAMSDPTASSADEMQRAIEALPAAEAAAPERFALYRRLIAAIYAEPRLNEFTDAILSATLSGVVAGDPGAADVLDAMIESASAAMRPMIKQVYEQSSLLYAHDTFATLEINELERLVETLETQQFVAFHEALNRAMTTVVGEDSLAFGERLGTILRANPY
jgi:hypothetical protein